MDRVLGLVAKYKAIKEPGQALREIRQKTSVRGLLHDLIRHQVKVILGRPESIEDGFVTVYDRALVIITQSGRVVNTIAAEELYIAAFVGVDPHMPGGMVDEVIEKHIALKSLLIKRLWATVDIALIDFEANNFTCSRYRSCTLI